MELIDKQKLDTCVIAIMTCCEKMVEGENHPATWNDILQHFTAEFENLGMTRVPQQTVGVYQCPECKLPSPRSGDCVGCGVPMVEIFEDFISTMP